MPINREGGAPQPEAEKLEVKLSPVKTEEGEDDILSGEEKEKKQREEQEAIQKNVERDRELLKEWEETEENIIDLCRKDKGFFLPLTSEDELSEGEKEELSHLQLQLSKETMSLEEAQSRAQHDAHYAQWMLPSEQDHFNVAKKRLEDFKQRKKDILKQWEELEKKARRLAEEHENIIKWLRGRKKDELVLELEKEWLGTYPDKLKRHFIYSGIDKYSLRKFLEEEGTYKVAEKEK